MPPRTRRPCTNCPKSRQELQRVKKTKAAKPAGHQSVLRTAIATDSEGERLWRWVAFGCGSAIGMLEGYYDSKLPGALHSNGNNNTPVAEIEALRARLDKLISKLRSKTHGRLES